MLLGPLVALVPLFDAPSCAAEEKEDESALRRDLRQLQEANRELMRRLEALEAATAPRGKPAGGARATTSAEKGGSSPPSTQPWDTVTERAIEDRVKDLEVGQQAQEVATRQIIADTLAKAGPKINSFLSLSGVTEVVASRTREIVPTVSAPNVFGTAGPTKQDLALGTVELDFDIHASNWLNGSLVVTYEGGGTKFLTSTGTEQTVDRFTLDRAHIRFGDFTQFPIAARLGLEVQHFGTSTGVARLDTLSLGSPLTTEVFENRQTAAGLEFAWPTPVPAPPPAPVVTPPVQPLVLAPAISEVARWLGYKPLPARIDPLTPVRPAADLPPLYGSFMVYKGSEDFGSDRTDIRDFHASIGYRTTGHCGKPYEELRSSLVCPWVLDAHVDYSTNVFESRFLHTTYLPFLTQIGSVPGIAASVKASLGPFAFVGEINQALDDATFVDGANTARSIKPLIWLVSGAYQFDWNPWVKEIGAQGDFVSVSYSESQDMAGSVHVLSGVPTRVGFVPERRLLVTAGEWVTGDLKVAVEYSANWDYSPSNGGTGLLVHGIFGLVQFNY